MPQHLPPALSPSAALLTVVLLVGCNTLSELEERPADTDPCTLSAFTELFSDAADESFDENWIRGELRGTATAGDQTGVNACTNGSIEFVWRHCTRLPVVGERWGMDLRFTSTDIAGSGDLGVREAAVSVMLTNATGDDLSTATEAYAVRVIGDPPFDGQPNVVMLEIVELDIATRTEELTLPTDPDKVLSSIAVPDPARFDGVHQLEIEVNVVDGVPHMEVELDDERGSGEEEVVALDGVPLSPTFVPRKIALLVGELDYSSGPLANATRTCIGKMDIEVADPTVVGP